MFIVYGATWVFKTFKTTLYIRFTGGIADQILTFLVIRSSLHDSLKNELRILKALLRYNVFLLFRTDCWDRLLRKKTPCLKIGVTLLDWTTIWRKTLSTYRLELWKLVGVSWSRCLSIIITRHAGYLAHCASSCKLQWVFVEASLNSGDVY